VQYIGANVPQAWAAGSAFMLTRRPGISAGCTAQQIVCRSIASAAWLPDLTMRNLRIGRHKLDIRFWREDAQTAFEVIGRTRAGRTLRDCVQDRGS
jgi:hypothetical protein